MKKDIKITESEWSVMEILWSTDFATIGEIKKALASTDWSDSTIKTLVRRLVSKKAIAINTDEAVFRYYPLISQQDCQRKETKNFINRVYEDSVSMLVTNLVADSNLSEKERKELLDLIEKMEKG